MPERRDPGSDPALTEDLLSALVDGELDDATRTDVEARLAVDAEWQAVLAEVAQTRAAVRGLGPVEVPDGFLDRVLSGADVVDLSARRVARAPFRRVASLGGIAAAAAFVIGVVVVPTDPPERVRPPVAAFTDAHATRASVGDDAISSLASVGLSRFGR